MKQKPTTNTTKPTPKPKGFAAMEQSEINRIAKMGGKAVSKNRDWMRQIGQRGGLANRTKKAA